MPGKQTDFITEKYVEAFIREETKLRASVAGVKQFKKLFNALMVAVLRDAGKRTKKAKRKIMPPSLITEAFEKHVGKKDLEWQEILDQLMNEAPTDLGKISEAILKHLDELKAQK
jgi:histone H3/H4